MNTLMKYKILEYSFDLHGIFMEYKAQMNLDIENKNLRDDFLKFLQEVIMDGYIKLGRWNDSFTEFNELEMPADRQIDLIRDKWPKFYDSNIPELDIEGMWWEVECPVGLASYPDWEKIIKDLDDNAQV